MPEITIKFKTTLKIAVDNLLYDIYVDCPNAKEDVQERITEMFIDSISECSTFANYVNLVDVDCKVDK